MTLDAIGSLGYWIVDTYNFLIVEVRATSLKADYRFRAYTS
jgi:hypothetical protein